MGLFLHAHAEGPAPPPRPASPQGTSACWTVPAPIDPDTGAVDVGLLAVLGPDSEVCFLNEQTASDGQIPVCA